MNKKFVVLGILAVLMLLTISLASAINTQTNVEKKESPLYKIRTKLAIGEKISQIFQNIKIKFLGERLFLIPFQWLKNVLDPYEGILYTSDEGGKLCTAYTLSGCGPPNRCP